MKKLLRAIAAQRATEPAEAHTAPVAAAAAKVPETALSQADAAAVGAAAAGALPDRGGKAKRFAAFLSREPPHYPLSAHAPPPTHSGPTTPLCTRHPDPLPLSAHAPPPAHFTRAHYPLRTPTATNTLHPKTDHKEKAAMQARFTKGNLERLLGPGTRVFLDSDDLQVLLPIHGVAAATGESSPFSPHMTLPI